MKGAPNFIFRTIHLENSQEKLYDAIRRKDIVFHKEH